MADYMTHPTDDEPTQDRDLLHLILKRLFYREPDFARWDGESDEILDRIALAYNECFDLTDFPDLHAKIDAYCRDNGLHTQHYLHEPEPKGD